jgi:hypothetical protein
VYVPGAGLNVGVAAAATWIRYDPVATALFANPTAAAIALIVVVLLTTIGLLYADDEVVGVLPSSV